jgi:Predicted Zn-dependent proteases and their inactivated homologs
MISQKHKELAQRMMEFALENGCSDARISIYSGDNSSFEYRDTQLDKLQQSVENSMEIELFTQNRYATYSTNRIEEKELKKFILNGIETTRYLAEDTHRQLPNPQRYYKGNGESLNTCDPTYDSISADKKIGLAKNAVNEVYGSDSRITSITAGFSSGKSGSYMISSNGFEGASESTYYSLSASTSLKDTGDARPSSYWYDTALFWDKLEKENIGKKALERTIRKLGQSPIESGIYPMLVDNLQIGRLLSPIISALYGNSLQQKNSFLLDKIGEKIVSDRFTLIDDPHIPNAIGARWFDGEGVATEKRTVIEKGILKTYYIDTYIASKMDLAPTIQGPSILTCAPGSHDFNQLKSTVNKGIWITGFNGGNSNSTTGDFSFGVEGFLIENGKETSPINEMNITGNLLELWKNIIEVGNDPKENSSWRIPSILFDKVTFSGK